MLLLTQLLYEKIKRRKNKTNSLSDKQHPTKWQKNVNNSHYNKK